MNIDDRVMDGTVAALQLHHVIVVDCKFLVIDESRLDRDVLGFIDILRVTVIRSEKHAQKREGKQIYHRGWLRDDINLDALYREIDLDIDRQFIISVVDLVVGSRGCDCGSIIIDTFNVVKTVDILQPWTEISCIYRIRVLWGILI